MKKFFAIAAIAGVLVACGNDADNTTTVDTTTTTTVDPATTDTTGMGVTMDTSAANMGNTGMDTTTMGTGNTDTTQR